MSYKNLTLLLYEAMSYTTDLHEAFLQLGLLLCCPPSATMEMLKIFSNLYQWLTDGEITGRFLRQSLYEGGRPLVGKMMMKWGHET
jgi:hypothetical protein